VEMGIRRYMENIGMILLVEIIFVLFFTASAANASQFEWGGHLRVQNAAYEYTNSHLPQEQGNGTYQKHSLDCRLKNRIYLFNNNYFDLHYEIAAVYSELKKRNIELSQNPGTSEIQLEQGVDDGHRLFDLSSVISTEDDLTFYHRLDRLSLTFDTKSGVFRLGRQALTWGNGMLFNPLDLFNPFSPADFARDYKIADDLVSWQYTISDNGEIQLLYIPRRSRETGKLDSDLDSGGIKYHLITENNEFDFLFASHYEDLVLGLGASGYLINTAWRLDMTWTNSGAKNNDSFYSIVANMDYSWIWLKKNLYGFIEIYYNGIGNTNCIAAMENNGLQERISRGQIFTLGKRYLAAQVRLEIHPLINAYLTSINNFSDFSKISGTIQPRIGLDLLQDMTAIIGANFFYGDHDSEYGGYEVKQNYFESPDQLFIMATLFF
jgi:hypothetical protein